MYSPADSEINPRGFNSSFPWGFYPSTRPGSQDIKECYLSWATSSPGAPLSARGPGRSTTASCRRPPPGTGRRGSSSGASPAAAQTRAARARSPRATHPRGTLDSVDITNIVDSVDI